MITTTIYHVCARIDWVYETFLYPTLESAVAAMGVLERIDEADDIQAVGCDSDRVFCRADFVSSGAVCVEFFATPVPVSADTIFAAHDCDISDVLYIMPTIIPEHGKMAAAGVTGTKADLAFHVAHGVAGANSRRLDDVLTTLMDVAARGSLQASDVKEIDGRYIDIVQSIADSARLTRAQAYQEITDGHVSYDTLITALVEALGEPR